MAKAPPDPRGKHVRLYLDILESPAWKALTPMDRHVYVTMRARLGRSNNADISMPLSVAAHYGITSPATLAKSLRALQAVGLIALTRSGGCQRGGQRLPSLYRFTDEGNGEMKKKSGGVEYLIPEHRSATNEWKKLQTLAQAKAAIQAFHEAAVKKKPTSKIEAVPVQILKQSGPRPLQILKYGHPDHFKN